MFHRTPINYLLVNLAIGDIKYVAFIAPEVITTITGNHPGGVGGTVLCKLLSAGIFAWVGGIPAMVTLVVIAFERYFAVIYPHNNKRLTKKKLKVRQCLMGEPSSKLRTLQKKRKVVISTMSINCDKMLKYNYTVKIYIQFLYMNEHM